MRLKDHFKNALFALALTSLIAPQAEAIEIFPGTNPAAHVNDGLITQVRAARGGGMHRGGGGTHRGGKAMHRVGAYSGMHRAGGTYGMHRAGGAYRGNVNRNVNRNVDRAGYIRLSGRIRLSRRSLGWPSRLVPLAGRRHRGRRGDRLRRRGERGGPGRARRRSRGSAGITPTRANVRVSGTPARRAAHLKARQQFAPRE
jgi:hypothetical protein